ncbi:MAG TPA: hypothetical protein P5048_04485, partial [Chlamydiales bacterium]|nr:hypothetical protein [Chlamydiales bacterium]
MKGYGFLKFGFILFLFIFAKSYANNEYGMNLKNYIKPHYGTNFNSNIEGIDKIYVINLERDFERYEFMQNQLNRWNVVGNRFSGFDGSVFGFSSKTNKALGCCLSHLSVIYHAYHTGCKVIWILEDDVEINKDPQMLKDYI